MTQINVPVNPAVPDAYVQIISPPPQASVGVPTDLIGIVGTATWGPVNAPTTIGSNQQCQNIFGPRQNRKYDLGTAVATAGAQGAANFRCVRVTDGTDAAAKTEIGMTGVPTLVAGGAAHVVGDVLTFANGARLTVATISSGAILTVTVTTPPTVATAGTLVQTATTGTGTAASFSFAYTKGVTLTSVYTGSGANGDTVTVAAGSAAGTTKITVARVGRSPQVFDNIAGTANALYLAIAAAINSGLSALRGPSTLVSAVAGAQTVAITNGVYTLAGGLDGATTITGVVLVGADTGTRSGMYALRGAGPGMMVLADCDDSTTWAAQVALALSEGFYAILTGPAGEYTAPATVASNKATAAIDSYGAKLLVGDWPTWLDDVNGGILRVVSPQAFEAGRLATLGPHESSLNKPIRGIIATQKTAANQNYATADLQVFGQAGLDLLTSPSPGGAYFAARFGRNTSSNQATSGDNYSRMIPYLATLLASAVGQFVGALITSDETAQVKAALDAVCHGEWTSGRVSNPAGTQPYSITVDNSQAPRGIQAVTVKIQLGPVVQEFLLNLQAGQTVTVDTRLAA